MQIALGPHRNNANERRNVTLIDADGDIWFEILIPSGKKTGSCWCTPQDWTKWVSGKISDED